MFPFSSGDRKRILSRISKELNFFRVHILAFTFIPLVASGVFYASNGQYPVEYIDALFLCYSAMTVTGLSVTNLSTLTGWQQTILFILMAIGDITVVAFTMVLVRKYYFRLRCTYVLQSRSLRRPSIFVRAVNTAKPLASLISAPVNVFRFQEAPPGQPLPENGNELGLVQSTASDPSKPLHRNVLELRKEGDISLSPSQPHGTPPHTPPVESSNSQGDSDQTGIVSDLPGLTSSPKGDAVSLPPVSPTQSPMSPRTHIEFANLRRRTGPLLRAQTMLAPSGPGTTSSVPAKEKGLGGFPTAGLAPRLARRALPGLYKKVERKLTLPLTTTLHSAKSQLEGNTGRAARWLHFDGLEVGRNSDFKTETLTDEQLEEIGGTEYRALRLLSYLVGFYFVGMQLFAFILIAPWLSSTSKYDSVFESQPRLVPKAWFAAFQVVASYTGGGMSLVDQGMVPFQPAILMIIAMAFVILAGNHGLPIFLRLIIWIGTKIVPEGGEMDETLHFLLDHPRRCFIYLFPSHQTWFLTATLVFLSAIEWSAFSVLNRGLPVYESIPLGNRVAAGFFQSLAVRASGFAIVNLSALAPSVQFLYVIMMYIAVYPVAMSIRSTNVYEERSLGVFEMPPANEDEEPDLAKIDSRGERIGKYISWHLRRQLAFDAWWLILGIWLVCINERTMLMDDVNAPWFNMFRIIFELVSAYGGIGLSLGIPTENYSFSGALKPLSKIIVILVMLRGRHRGLPVAVDRSVMLPHEFRSAKARADAEEDLKHKQVADAEQGEKGKKSTFMMGV